MHRGVSRMGIQGCCRAFFQSSAYLNPSQLPSPMETHLWYVKPGEVKCESLMKHYFDILSPCERVKVLEIMDEELRRSALLSRVLARTTISRYWSNSPIDPRTLKFQKNMYGKPEVDWGCTNDSKPLYFNISHTSSLVACAISSSSQIGVDVEEKKRRIVHNILSFAKRYFTHHEVQFLASITDPHVQRLEFLKLWTLKESYVKAIGKGFSGAPFKTFDISFKNKEGSLPTQKNVLEVVINSLENSAGTPLNWQFVLLELEKSYFAAICTERQSASNGMIYSPSCCACRLLYGCFCFPLGRGISPTKLKVWRTLPYVRDEFVSETDAVTFTCGLR